MNTTTEPITTVERAADDTALVRGQDGFAVRHITRRDRAVARIFSRSLDGELAAGEAPEDRWLRAVRAAMLCSANSRKDLAQAWADVLERARGSHRRPPAVIPLRGAQTNESRELIAMLIDALEAPGSASVRGVAMARALLTDGTGPLYSPRSGEHLSAAIVATMRCLRSVE